MRRDIWTQACKEQDAFVQRMQIRFDDINLLRQAFMHCSFARNNEFLGIQDNERLEFFGDSVINVLVAEFLMKRFPRKKEGDLTLMLSALVKGVTLGEIALALGLERCICVVYKSLGPEQVKARKKILGDTFEAFVGALALDQGYGVCRTFLEKVMFPRVDALKKKNLQCAKALLQRRSLWEENINPRYHMVDNVTDEQGVQKFHAEVSIHGVVIATGVGFSRKEAEEAAADTALWQYPRSTRVS